METEAGILYNPSSSNHLEPVGVRARFGVAWHRTRQWRFTLAEETRKPTSLLVPMLSFAFAIFIQTVAGAYFIGRLAERVDNLSGNVQEMRGSMGQTVDQQVENRLLKEKVERLSQEMRLMKDFTEGRISHLPYRQSIKLEGERP